MNTKLHAVTDAEGRPIRFFMTASHVSDYTGTAALVGNLPKADWLLADGGCDAYWFRYALKEKRIKPCILGGKCRPKPIKDDKCRKSVEITFGNQKDCRRIASRYEVP